MPQPIEQNVGRIDAFIHTDHGETFNAMQSMVYDATGHSFNSIEIEESPNPTTQHFLICSKHQNKRCGMGTLMVILNYLQCQDC